MEYLDRRLELVFGQSHHIEVLGLVELHLADGVRRAHSLELVAQTLLAQLGLELELGLAEGGKVERLVVQMEKEVMRMVDALDSYALSQSQASIRA